MNIFEDGFEEPKVNFPIDVVQDAIKGFEKATQGLASLIGLELDTMERMGSNLKDNTFQYQIILTSKYLKGYSFQVLQFGYDVTIYPVVICVQSEIGVEIKFKRSVGGIYKISCADEKNLLQVINAAFSTTKFKRTVGGLMKIARVKSETT